MSDFSDIYGGGSGAALLPGGFGNFRPNWAYPVPLPQAGSRNRFDNFQVLSDSADRVGEIVAANTVYFTPFLVPAGASATTTRVWCFTRSDSFPNGTGGVIPVPSGNALRVAIYSVGASGVLTRVGSDVEISLAGAAGPKSGSLSAPVSGGSAGAVYLIACNKTGGDATSILFCHRGGTVYGSGTADVFWYNNPWFTMQTAVLGVPYSGTTLPAQSAQIGDDRTAFGWALQGGRTYGAFPATLNMLTDLTSFSTRRSAPQFLVGF